MTHYQERRLRDSVIWAVWFSFSGFLSSSEFRFSLVLTDNPSPQIVKFCNGMLVNCYVIALMLRVTFMKYIKGSGGRRKKRGFLSMHYQKKCFLPKSCKRKKRSLWNTLQQFGTHTEQFHFRASSKLFQRMLVNKGNLHWKSLQEHRPFHVSQQGSSAFTPGLLLSQPLSVLQSILSGSYTSACPQCLSITYSASKPSQKCFCSHNLSPSSGTHLSDIWSSRKVHFSKRSAWNKTHTENSKLTLPSYLSVMGVLPWRAPWNLLLAPEQEPSSTPALAEKNNGSGWKIKHFPLQITNILRKDT